VSRARRAALVAAALLAPACSYDLNALRASDAAVDRPRPTDNGAVDRGVAVDVGEDRPAPVDAGRADTGLTRAGTCDTVGGTVVPLAAPLPATGSTTPLAYAMARGDLAGAAGLPLPTSMDGGVVAGCPYYDPVRSPPTRVYRYQVVEGGTVTATTNTQLCTEFDTRVYAIWSCKTADLARPAACGDDLTHGADTARCPACSAGPDADAGPGVCTPNVSTIETPPTEVLRRGDTVFFAVTGFHADSNQTPFRLWVGENAARIEPLPSTASVPLVNRCVCQANTDAARTASFPYLATTGNFPVSAVAGGPSFLGARSSVPAGVYSGVSMQLRVARWTLASGCAAASVRAVFDLIVGNTLVTTFSVPATLTPPVTVAVPYTAFAPVMLNSTSAGMAMELRLRTVQPQATCLAVELDPAQGASTVTLYGG
jgi:hypothetical protein